MQLFNPKTIKLHVDRAAAPDPAKLEIIRGWGATVQDRSIETQSETAIEDQFKQRIVRQVLGYLPFNEEGTWTIALRAAIGSGAVDLRPVQPHLSRDRDAGSQHLSDRNA